jgi:putative ABC transport system ATP-binding protein
MESNAYICIRQLHKSFVKGDERVEVLQALDLDIQQGEFVSLMGPSGSGKSSLLNLIGGLDVPDQGQIFVQNQALHQFSPAQSASWRAKSVGFIFQFYNLLPGLTALQNVQLPLLLTTMSGKERQRRAEIALDLVGMLERKAHKPAELSGGQEQRVAIARALVTDPQLILADEPTGDLDRATADEVLQLLRALQQDYGKTIVMVTHDSKAAESASRHIVMDKGRLAAQTRPRQVA